MPTSFSSPSNSPADPWEQQTSTRPSSRKPVPVVRDDWEDEEDEEENGVNVEVDAMPDAPQQGRAEVPPTPADRNRSLWEAANNQITDPMPTLLASRTGSAVPPPAAAFQPALRILKRPQNPSPSQSTQNNPSPQGDSLQDREARYAAARERIFGLESTGGSDNGTSSPKPDEVKIMREPKAPELTPGFRGRGNRASRPTTTS